MATHYEVRTSSTSPTSAYFDVYATSKGGATLTWDSNGNLTDEVDARGTETHFTIDTTNFGLGETTQVQEGYNQATPKAPTTYSYVDSSNVYHNGLLMKMTTAVPGTVGGTSTNETDYNYDEATYVGTGVALGLRITLLQLTACHQWR